MTLPNLSCPCPPAIVCIVKYRYSDKYPSGLQLIPPLPHLPHPKCVIIYCHRHHEHPQYHHQDRSHRVGSKGLGPHHRIDDGAKQSRDNSPNHQPEYEKPIQIPSLVHVIIRPADSVVTDTEPTTKAGKEVGIITQISPSLAKTMESRAIGFPILPLLLFIHPSHPAARPLFTSWIWVEMKNNAVVSPSPHSLH